jgi:hypothetical protein
VEENSEFFVEREFIAVHLNLAQVFCGKAKSSGM